MDDAIDKKHFNYELLDAKRIETALLSKHRSVSRDTLVLAKQISVADVDVSLLAGLRRCFLDYCRVKTLSSSSSSLSTNEPVTSLQELHLCCDEISDIPSFFAKQLPNLKVLTMSRNNFKTLDSCVYLPSSLMVLDLKQNRELSNCSLRPLEQLTNMQRLNLASCCIESLETLPLFPVLKHLGLACNKLDNLACVVDVLRRHTPTLESLELAGNPLYVKKWRLIVAANDNDDNNNAIACDTSNLNIVDCGTPLDENLFDLEQYSIVILCRYLIHLKKLDDRLLARLIERIDLVKHEVEEQQSHQQYSKKRKAISE